MEILWGSLVILASAGLGMTMQFKWHIDAPVGYWLLGVVSVVLALLVGGLI